MFGYSFQCLPYEEYSRAWEDQCCALHYYVCENFITFQGVNCLSLSVWRRWRCTTGSPTGGRRWRGERISVRTWSLECRPSLKCFQLRNTSSALLLQWLPTRVEMLVPLPYIFFAFLSYSLFFHHNQKLPFWKAMALRWRVQAANPTARRQRCTSLPIRSIIGSPSK